MQRLNMKRRASQAPADRRHLSWGTFLVAIMLLSFAGCNQASTTPDQPAMHRANPARTGVYQPESMNTYESIKWQFETGDWVFGAPAVSSDAVFFGSYDGLIYAADAETGEERWRFETTQPIIASPATADGMVFAGSMDGHLYALDERSGEEQWQVDIGGGIIGSPAVVENLVYVAADNGLLLALETRTGEELWRFQKDNEAIVFSPAVADGTVFVPLSDGILYALDAQSGDEAWRYDSAANTENVYQPAGDIVVADGRVYFMTTDLTLQSTLHAIDLETHEPVWLYATPAEVFSGPTASGGRLVWGALDGNIYAVDAQTGELSWTFTTGGPIFSAAAVAGNTLIFGSVDKTLYAVDIRNGQERWQFRAESPVSSPAVAQGVVYVGTESGVVYAIR